MNIDSWNRVDILIMVAQCIILISFYMKNKKLLGNLYATTLCLSAWLIITPIGLIPVAIINTDRSNVFRLVFWEFKIGGLSINDILIISLFFVLFLHFLLRYNQKVDINFYKIIYAFIISFFIGCVSSLLSPKGVDFERFLIVGRYFLLILIALFSTLLVNTQNSNIWLKKYILLLLKISILSILSLAILSTDYRPNRYWTYAWLQSQESQSIFILIFAYGLFIVRNSLKKILLIMLGLFPALVGYKYSIYIIILCLVLNLIMYLLKKPLYEKIIKNSIRYGPILLILFPIIIIQYFVINYSDMGSLSTRYYQFINVWANLKEEGFLSLIFGIGWNQWYYIYYPFPFLDLGAWTDDQIYSANWKYSVQILPFSLIRSIGILGLFVWLYGVITTLKLFYNKYLNNDKRYISFYFVILVFYIQTYLYFPDVLPEGILNISIIVNGLLINTANSLKGQQHG